MPVQFNRDAFVEILDRSNYASRADFAREVGISPGALHDIAASRPRRQPSDDLICRLAAELKIPVTAIICSPESVAS